MANSKKWSEQILIEESFETQVNGEEVIEKQNVLSVCTSGMSLYKKYFVDGKYKDKKQFVVPFDFIVLSDSMCSDGRFYELEYFLGDNGAVYRALIQAANPVTDLPMIIGALQRNNLLPAEFNPRKAWLRGDIDTVSMGGCCKDEDGEPVFYCGYKEAKDPDISLKEYSEKYHDACIEYYRGDVREVWVKHRDSSKPIFVCGSDNVEDPAFEAQHEADMAEFEDLLGRLMTIIGDYNIPHFISIFDRTDKDGLTKGTLSTNMTKGNMEKVIETVFQNKNNGTQD